MEGIYSKNRERISRHSVTDDHKKTIYLTLSPSALTFHSLLPPLPLPPHTTRTRTHIANSFVPPRLELSPPRSGIKSALCGVSRTRRFPTVKTCSPVGSCPRNSSLAIQEERHELYTCTCVRVWYTVRSTPSWIGGGKGGEGIARENIRVDR